ncbi:MAG: protein kinase domain-containing protein [Planctomycetota bacterium]
MIGAQVGPYTVQSELGTGGMGSVFLATGEDGARVALKIVHPHLIATPGFFKRFLREAELGKQVRHENVVRTLDVDATIVDDKQVNYMVLEYVEGRSLRDLLHDLGSVPESLLREIALQMAAGVEAIHSENVVHRDLKPENVLITDDHRIRIMDLGVAKLQEASVALTKEGQFAGSFLYAAPEQFTDDEVGTAADLYSVGVMLYELATGSNPFKHDDPARVINAHLSTKPPPATERAPDLSPFFAEVIATLLEKDVADRFASSSELREVLDAGTRSEWWAEREKSLRHDERSMPKLRVPTETALHGRDEDLEALQEAWQSAKAGQGNTVLIEGEPGIGKTRLLDAFLRTVDDASFHVLYGAYPPSGGLGALSEAVLGKFGAAGLEEAVAPYLTVTPSLIPSFAALIKHETPPTGTEPLHGEALQAVCAHLMRALSEEHPTIWIIEDLNFAPRESRDLLHALARAVAPLRVLLIITTRPGMAESELSHFTRLGNLQRRTLARLGARDVIELLRDAFKSESIAAKLGGTIAYKSDGVPFFVFEMIRGLKSGSLLKQQPDGSYVQTQVISEIEVPSAVKDLIEARLEGLSKDERAVLDLGAVQGFEFDPDLVARVRGLKRIQVLEMLADLERRSGIVRGGAGVCSFDQYQIHELLLERLMPDLRAEYHTLLAEAFAEREGIDEPDEDLTGEEALFLAWHAMHGSNPRFGLPYLNAALAYLSSAYRTDAALTLASRALEAKRLLKGPDRVEVLLHQAALLNQLGRREEESDVLEEALRLADKLEDLRYRSRARRAVGWQAHVRGKNDEALPLLTEAAELAKEGEFQAEEADAVGALGVVFALTGKPEEAIKQFERHLEIARALGDRRGEATATSRAGAMHFTIGNLAESIAYTEKSLALSEEIDLERHGIDNMNLAEMLIVVGQSERASELFEKARSIFHSIGSRRYEAMVLGNQGRLHQRFGESEAAAQQFREALQLQEQVGDLRSLALSHCDLGRLGIQDGNTSEADRQLDEARAIANRIGAPEFDALAAANMALLPGGDVDAARRALREHGARLEFPEEMSAFFALWKAGGNSEDLAKAYEMLTHLRDRAPEEYRESMIENVPLHKAIMEAHGE